MERRQPASMRDEDASASAALAAIGARRPLISSSGAVVGFEYRIGSQAVASLRRAADRPAQAAHLSAVLTYARLIAQTGMLGLARFPCEWLSLSTNADLCAGVMIGLEASGLATPALAPPVGVELDLAALRAKGAQIGWDEGFSADLRPDFVFLRQGALAMSVLLDGFSAWPTAFKDLPILVTDVANVEDLELALYNGVTFVCGALAPEREAVETSKKRSVSPEVRRIGQLLQQLSAGAETARIVEQIKGDVGLSYRLLRLMNSASYAQLVTDVSVDHAVLLLGRYELHRWLSMLLVHFEGSRKISCALQEIALWRARLLELLAIERQEAAPGQFFTLGLASMLGLLLKVSESEVVSTLHLPQSAQQALLDKAGPWYVYLQIAQELELRTLPESQALAPFGGVGRVMALSDQAWSWAAAQGEVGEPAASESLHG